MNNKSFVKHFFIIGSGTAINMVLGLITTPLITRVVDPLEYGQLSIFNMYSSISVMILCLGLDQALIRYFYNFDNIEYKSALLYKCIRLPVIVSILFAVLVIIISAFGLFQFEFSTGIMIWFCIYTLFQVIYRFSQLTLRLQYKSVLYSKLNVINRVLYLLIAILLILLVKGAYFTCLVIATTIPIIVCTCISIISERSLWKFPNNVATIIGVTNRELLYYATPFIISMGVTTLFQAIDKIFLNYYCTYVEVGVYSSAITLVNIFAIIQTTFNALWGPMQVENYTKNPNDHTFYQRGNKIITVVMFFLGITLVLFKDLFVILLGEKYREAAYILPFLIFNPIMCTISETTYGGLVFKNKSNMQVVVALGACITNIIGNSILVPYLGCKGAAISTGISYIVFFSLRTMLANKFFYTDYKLRRFYAMTVIVMLYALYNTFIEFNFGSIIAYILCIVALGYIYKDGIAICIEIVFLYKDKIIEKLHLER